MFVDVNTILLETRDAGTDTPRCDPGQLRRTFHVAKFLTFGRTRTVVGVDLFNALNSSVVAAQNNTYGPRWLTPTGILQARLVKVSAQLDF